MKAYAAAPSCCYCFVIVLLSYLGTLNAFLSGALVGTCGSRRTNELRRESQSSWRRHQGTTSHEVVIDPASVLSSDTTAHISSLIEQRATLRWQGDYSKADEVRSLLDHLVLPQHCRIAIADNPRDEGGGSSWSLIYDVPIEDFGTEMRPSVLNLAHKALGLAVSYAERGEVPPVDLVVNAVEQAKEQLLKWRCIDIELRGTSELPLGLSAASFAKLVHHSSAAGTSTDMVTCWATVESQLSGRKAADAAFWFAVAGVTDLELFDLLTLVCAKELHRFGDRPSCRSKDIMAIVERLSAAGTTDGVNRELEVIVHRCLTTKAVEVSRPIFSLHSDYCAVMIWNFSTRQRKQKSFLAEAAMHWKQQDCSSREVPVDKVAATVGHSTAGLPWNVLFEDPTRDLVIDVGCGMGVSILGLASLSVSDPSDVGFNWSACNFVGVDLSPLTVNYANGIAKRWGLGRQLIFLVNSADQFLDLAKTYPGSTTRILIQFPTPYRLQSSLENGNSQLPKTVSDGFMVTEKVLQLASVLLRKRHGELILQSNCEDVAIWMRQAAVQQAGFAFRDAGEAVHEIQGMPTQRTLNWVASGGERAIGPGWCPHPVLPRTGRTETEIACIMNGTPVHRCVLVATGTASPV